MNQINHWKDIKISKDKTHFLVAGHPVFGRKFREVLKFHAPGLAPVQDETGWYHIDTQGQALYPQRYHRSFGYYQNRASVMEKGQFFHLDEVGQPIYNERYAFTGNYQEGRCVVRDFEHHYFHLNLQGQRVYLQNYRYVGDYKDGYACVQLQTGKFKHIDAKGTFIYDNEFLDLGVFHKQFATAKDENGYFHIDLAGNPIYPQRYAMLEPFYNGQARVQTHAGAYQVIDEAGQVLLDLSPPPNPFPNVSQEIVAYWRSYTLYAGVRFQIFDALPGTVAQIAKKTGLSEAIAHRLLRALWEMDLIRYQPESEHFQNLAAGELLKTSQAYSLAPAAISFIEAHIPPWMEIVASLQLGNSAFLQKAREDWFQHIAHSAKDTQILQDAFNTYALHDYANIAQVIDAKRHHIIIDAGGGQGTLLKNMLSAFPQLKGILFERPEVATQITIPEALADKLKIHVGTLLEPWALSGDAIILARILHDWDDENALKILKFAKEALTDDGVIYILEFLLLEGSPNGGLLDLNMLVTTGGQERTLAQFVSLFEQADLALLQTRPLSSVSTVLVVKKA